MTEKSKRKKDMVQNVTGGQVQVVLTQQLDVHAGRGGLADRVGRRTHVGASRLGL